MWTFQSAIDLGNLRATLPAELKNAALIILPVLCKFYQQNKQPVPFVALPKK